ncbi:MAG: hypothetical protein IGS48_15525 [Oscillatoriales cyanobacterium C42_A2020_001]|nr:hypothetical protein [Leptolyngbyaceae cyanobacterium C42_A2020_001]
MSPQRAEANLSRILDAMRPAIEITYQDLIKPHGVIWLCSSILFVLPRLLLELINIWLKSREPRNYYPFLNYEPLMPRSRLDIRQEFDWLPLLK